MARLNDILARFSPFRSLGTALSVASAFLVLLFLGPLASVLATVVIDAILDR